MIEKFVLHRVLKGTRWGRLSVTYPDGCTETYGHQEPDVGRLIFKSRDAVWSVLLNGNLGFSQHYIEGSIDFDGDLSDLVWFGWQNAHFVSSWFSVLRARHRTSMAADRRNVRSHYDLGNDFFRLFLDRSMTYSCAYFNSTSDSLDTAQDQKIRNVLRKLNIKPGQSVLDIGSGWGELILSAASNYGATATGITVSIEQYEETQRRIHSMQLSDRVSVSLSDYRQLAASGKQFDRVVSVGMLEHVGQANLSAFIAALKKLTKPGGLILLHHITRPVEAPMDAFTERYIFPGAYIPSLREVIHLLPERDLRVLDVENLRPHYALTLERWAQNFERNREAARSVIGGSEEQIERFLRAWFLYLRGSAVSFRMGNLELHQILMSNGVTDDALPLMRPDGLLVLRNKAQSQPSIELKPAARLKETRLP